MLGVHPSSCTKTLARSSLPQEESLGERGALVRVTASAPTRTTSPSKPSVRRVSTALAPASPPPTTHRCSVRSDLRRDVVGTTATVPTSGARSRRVNWSTRASTTRGPWRRRRSVRVARCGVAPRSRSATLIRGRGSSRRAGREPPAAAREGSRAGRAARGAAGRGSTPTSGQHGVGGTGGQGQRRVQDEGGDGACIAATQDLVEAPQLVRELRCAPRGSVRPKGSADRAQSET